MTKKLTKDFVILGLALFAMFFGAGNLIFPPSLGTMAGESWLSAMIGFLLTGVGMPLLGIIAISKCGGTIESFSGKVNPTFSKIFGAVTFLILGPLLGVPRTGATTFEMGITPLIPQANSIIVSIVFFAITLFLVIKPSGIIDRIGKFLTPVLMLMLGIIIYRGVTSPMGSPINTAMANPFSTGFINGYQTMDVLVSVIVGGIIVQSLIEKGYTDKKEQLSMTLKAGLVSSLGLVFVYGGLLYLGATGSSVFSADMAKTSLTVAIVVNILGEIGKTVLGICVTFACLTTAIGVTATVGDYFSKLSKGKVSYQVVVTISVIISGIISNVGVEQIVKFASPILSIIYPVAIVLVIMNIFDNAIANKRIYSGAVYGTLVYSGFELLKNAGIQIPILTNMIDRLPFGNYGFGWVGLSIIGIIIAEISTKLYGENVKKKFA